MAGALREGVVAADAQAVEFEPGMRAWSELNDAERRSSARRMSVYAAMVHRLDENVGRVLRALEADGRLGNTIVVFMADNGAEGHDMEARANRDGWLDATFDNSTENIGSRTSYTSLGPGWARAGAAPFRASKSKISEGGIRVPAFVYLPGGSTGTSDAYLRAMDLAPTFLELATGTAQSQADTGMMGRSLAEHLRGGPPPYDDDEIVAYEVYGRLAAQRGHWKALLQEPPTGPAAGNSTISEWILLSRKIWRSSIHGY